MKSSDVSFEIQECGPTQVHKATNSVALCIPVKKKEGKTQTAGRTEDSCIKSLRDGPKEQTGNNEKAKRKDTTQNKTIDITNKVITTTNTRPHDTELKKKIRQILKQKKPSKRLNSTDNYFNKNGTENKNTPNSNRARSTKHKGSNI
ncbi:hypothetical protein K0M31_002104 [Melipona bicolor]|uniref:Uncharacterized protein n=1 Tax=Melipona bicolor TaxID=60889 RepID=A0AA40GH30_9HYME|nr:hypothetical protein K0M31_002104 [Melipona bicolor]